MDGVLADYYSHIKHLPNTTFRQKVLTHKIFEELPMLSLAQNLIKILKEYEFEWPDAKVEILSSGGSYKKEIFDEAVRQKSVWLDHYGITWKKNFTHCGESKAQFADPSILLIDDNDINCTNFKWNEGDALRWKGDMQSCKDLVAMLELEL
jgi:hypothetical protein